MFKETIQESTKLSDLNIEVINGIEQVDILFQWHGQNSCVQSYSWCESNLKVKSR
jgi:hypothetical protein